MKNDIAYNNMDFIPDAQSFLPRWEEEAREYREVEAALGRARLNDPYGEGVRQKIDFFHPNGPTKGLVVFVHGGYWHKFSRSDFSHFAGGAVARDWVVAMPSYTLAPNARISEMTREIAKAISHAASRIPGPIRLVGHSAGGHLVARMLCEDTLLSPEVFARTERIVPISPLGDLRPLLETSMNEILGLDSEEAENESPTLMARLPGPDVRIWVGSGERPVFLDQARGLSEVWNAPLKIEPDRHHLDVIEGMRDPESSLAEAILS